MLDYWNTWRDVYPHTPLHPTPKEVIALEQLIATGAGLGTFRKMAELMKRSPSLAGKRSLGMLRALWASLREWDDEYPNQPFGEVPKTQTPSDDQSVIARMRAKIVGGGA